MTPLLTGESRAEVAGSAEASAKTAAAVSSSAPFQRQSVRFPYGVIAGRPVTKRQSGVGRGTEVAELELAAGGQVENEADGAVFDDCHRPRGGNPITPDAPHDDLISGAPAR